MRQITKIIMAVALVVLVVWDIIAYIWGTNATISVIITDWSMYTPWVPFAFGFLMGHFFVPARGSE
jgi:F0F1-type ATP synthase assembly protein I